MERKLNNTAIPKSFLPIHLLNSEAETHGILSVLDIGETQLCDLPNVSWKRLELKCSTVCGENHMVMKHSRVNILVSHKMIRKLTCMH